MRKRRFTEKQMVTLRRETDKTRMTKAAKKQKVSESVIYAQRNHFCQVEAADVKRLKALEVKTTGSRSCWLSAI